MAAKNMRLPHKSGDDARIELCELPAAVMDSLEVSSSAHGGDSDGSAGVELPKFVGDLVITSV